jgi:hypothetical protein
VKNIDARRRVVLQRIFAVMIAVAAWPVVGCGERDRPPDLKKKSTELDAVPEPVKAAAAKALKGVKLTDAWENRDREGKLHSYEVRGKIPSTGKIREARVSPDGDVLEVE